MKLPLFQTSRVVNAPIEEATLRIQKSNWAQRWWSFTDSGYRIGLYLFFLSLLWFIGIHLLVTASKSESASFVPNYLISIGYTVHLLVVGKMKPFWSRQPDEGLPHRLLNWWIWVISCFALNRSLPIFQESAVWVCVALVVSGTLTILYSRLSLASARFREVFYFCWGSSLCLWLYFTGYLLWLYPVSFLGILFFGLGFHTFVPLLLLIAHFKVITKGLKSLEGLYPGLGYSHR